MKRSQRQSRKLEHMKYALQLGQSPVSTHFEDLHFLHNCLPELNPADIVLSTRLFGRKLRLPLLIDAITGGTDEATALNRRLARAAARCGIGMAVGSQYGAVQNGECPASFTVVREENPDGLVIANISALATPEQAQAAVEMLAADALEIHLNAAQELCMAEGDKLFAGMLANMQRIREHLSVPVIVKETGCGIAAEQYLLLQKAGFTAFDCAGAGGTSFPLIEAARSKTELPPPLASWGTPACWSLLDGAETLAPEAVIIASGGIADAEQILKALALGADAVGMARLPLRLVAGKDEDQPAVEELCACFENLDEILRRCLLLLGCRDVRMLRQTPLVITGTTHDFAACRGYDLALLCRSRRC